MNGVPQGQRPHLARDDLNCRVLCRNAERQDRCATGNTTGKLSVLQGSKLARVVGRHSRDVLQMYISGNAAALR